MTAVILPPVTHDVCLDCVALAEQAGMDVAEWCALYGCRLSCRCWERS